MSDVSKADLSVRIVENAAQADQSVFVVNQKSVSGTPTVGQVPVEQADGSLAWGGPFSPGLTRVAVVTAATYTAAANELVPVDTTNNAVTVTLPTAPADKTRVAVKHIIQGGANAVSVLAAGGDVFNKAGGGTSLSLPLVNQAILLDYAAATHVWTVLADDLPLADLDLRFATPASVTAAIATAEAYTDAALENRVVKAPARLATTAALPANVYVAGVLTAAVFGALTVDGSVVAVGDVILVKNEVAGANNGLYSVTVAGAVGALYVLTRTADMKAGSEVPGAYVEVLAGATLAGTSWEVVSPGPYTLGTTAITWTEFQGGVLPKTGGTMSGAIAMGTNKITGLGDPTAAQDAVTKNYGDTSYVPSAATQAGTDAAPTTTTVWRLNAPADGAHGPFSLVIGGALFQSTYDRVMYLGYNADSGGGKLLASEPKFSLQIEADYDDGTKRVIESYLEYAPAAAVTVTDGVTTSGSPTVTFASTTLTSTAHKGQGISGSGIPASSYIGVVNSAHSIGLSSSPTANTPVNATATASGVSLTITPGGTTGMRPIFWQINRATGRMTDFEISSLGVTFTDWVSGATWGVLNSSGLTITPPAGGGVTLNLASVAGSINVFQISNTGGAFQIFPLTANGTAWNVNIAGSTVAQLSGSGLRLSLADSGAGVIIPKDGAYSIRNAADSADLPMLRNISNELYVGGNTWVGLTVAVGGNQAFRAINDRSVLLGSTAIATTSVAGFPHIPAASGAPTGVPTANSGFVPIYYDTSAHKIWVYDGGWKGILVV